MRNFQGIIFKCLSDFLLFKLLIDPVASKKTVCIDKSSYISVGFSLEYEAMSWKTKLPTKQLVYCEP